MTPVSEAHATVDPAETLPLSGGQSHAAKQPAEDQHKREVVYTPHGHLGLGLAAWREMFRELAGSRELTWRFFLRDFSARYRQSFLGYVWAVVPAIVFTLTFTLLRKAAVLPIQGSSLPYPVFALLGITVWQLFATGLTASTQSLVTAGSLIAKINFPRETLVLAAFGQSIVQFLISSVLVAGAFVAFGAAPAWTVILIPFAVIPLCLFTLGLGFFAALINGVLRDAGQMVTFILTFWMILTPGVLYPAPTEGTRALLNVLNPVSPFVIAAQDLASKGSLSQPGSYLIACAVAVTLFLLGWRVFHLTEPRIAERV